VRGAAPENAAADRSGALAATPATLDPTLRVSFKQPESEGSLTNPKPPTLSWYVMSGGSTAARLAVSTTGSGCGRPNDSLAGLYSCGERGTACTAHAAHRDELSMASTTSSPSASLSDLVEGSPPSAWPPSRRRGPLLPLPRAGPCVAARPSLRGRRVVAHHEGVPDLAVVCVVLLVG
jgi:hypothetical protein